MDKLANIDNRIEQLKKRKAKIQTQQAVLFTKEAEKIFAEGFSPDIALAVLSDWTTASDHKKKEWTARAHSFRTVSIQKARPKAETHDSTAL
jgi:hypothetical protein